MQAPLASALPARPLLSLDLCPLHQSRRYPLGSQPVKRPQPRVGLSSRTLPFGTAPGDPPRPELGDTGGRTRYLNNMLTVQEAAGIVKLTQWAIYRAIARGDLVAYKPGGRLRINEDDLQAWLEATRVSPAAPEQPPAPRIVPPPDLIASPRRGSTEDTLRARVRAKRRKQSAA